jgi:SAM-dependent methyltransferase
MQLTDKIRVAIMMRSRDSKVEHFYSMCKDGMTVLDVGVSDAAQHKKDPVINYFLKTYRYAQDTYTGLGVRDISGLAELYPKSRFVRYDGSQFPFADHQFDFVFSNAVIEHVGGREAQALFLEEMLRVGKQVFFTTPSKFFPVETHTRLIFLHWHDGWFQIWLKKHRPNASIHLLSYGNLVELLRGSRATEHSIRRNKFFGITMTMTVVARRE